MSLSIELGGITYIEIGKVVWFYIKNVPLNTVVVKSTIENLCIECYKNITNKLVVICRTSIKIIFFLFPVCLKMEPDILPKQQCTTTQFQSSIAT